jgi:hypothetical protein
MQFDTLCAIAMLGYTLYQMHAIWGYAAAMTYGSCLEIALAGRLASAHNIHKPLGQLHCGAQYFKEEVTLSRFLGSVSIRLMSSRVRWGDSSSSCKQQHRTMKA